MERRKLVILQRQLREVEGSSSAAAVQAGEAAALRETIASLKADLKVICQLIIKMTPTCILLAHTAPRDHSVIIVWVLHCSCMGTSLTWEHK